jgi:hypothetical protein
MPHPCPGCGAVHREDTSCQAVFASFLALELSDPGYGEVHMLTVACYMIQHARCSDEVLLWIRDKLRAHLEGGLPVDAIRRQAGREAGQRSRTWQINRPPGARPLPTIAWTMTIADVGGANHDATS